MTSSVVNQAEKGALLGRLHAGPDTLLLPNAWDVASALMLQQAGFKALATSSSGIAFSQGFADGERIGRERMLQTVARIVDRVSVPVSADLECGYATTPADVAETTRLAIEAGVVGLNLEDYPPGGPELMNIADACAKVQAVRKAADATGIPFVINARTDPFLARKSAGTEANLKEAIERGNAFVAAGADCIFVPGALDRDTIAALVDGIEGPLNVLGAFSGYTAPSLSELQALGVRRVSIGGSLALASWTWVRQTAKDLIERGVFDYGAGALSNAEFNGWLAAPSQND